VLGVAPFRLYPAACALESLCSVRKQVRYYSPMPYLPYERMAHAVRMAQRQKLIILGKSLLAPVALFVYIGISVSHYPDVAIYFASLPRFRSFYLASFIITYWLLRRADH
jgi:hypothetical protein